MKKAILILVSLFLVSFCYANGRCEKLKREIMKNPNVSKVLRLGQYDKWTQEIYWANIRLKNGGFLQLTEFDRNLTGDRLCIEFIGRHPDGRPEYEFICGMDGINCYALSALFNKDICTVNDIINSYDEIYKLAEALAKESPEERSVRMKMKRTDSDFTEKIGNFDDGKFYGRIFAKRREEEYNSMFADE